MSGRNYGIISDMLHFRTTSITGRIMINGRERNVSEFRKLSAYIMQDDNLQPLLTVQEAMLIAADLKLGLDHREKSQKVGFIKCYYIYNFSGTVSKISNVENTK